VYTAFAVNNKGKVRGWSWRWSSRHPLPAEVRTFRELGIDWVDGAFRGIGMPKSTPPEARRRMSELWAASRRLGDEGTGGEKRLRAGERRRRHDGGFMKERVRAYTEAGKRMGLGR